MLLFARVHLMRILMDDCWCLNYDRVLDVWDWAVYDEVIYVIVGINVCDVLTEWIMGFRLWCLVDIDYIFHLKVILLLKVLGVVSACTLVIEINSA